MPVKKTNTTPANQSSDKLLGMLEVMVAQPGPSRLQDIAEKCEMNPSTALRFISALQKRNYVAQDIDTGRYYATLKICALANNISSHNSIRTIAGPFMKSVVNISRESCNLAVENNMQVMYIDVINSPYNLLLSTQRIGNIAPMHCTGIGKLFLAEYTDAEMDRFCSTMGLARFTENTITDMEQLNKELESVRRLGYAFDNQECEMGVRCVAVPIRDYTGEIHAGLSISGPVIRLTDEYIYKNLEFLQDTAKQISMCMGWQMAKGS